MTLEDKVRIASSQNKKYEDTIHFLEIKIKMYESHHYKQGTNASSRNLDQFLKLLEDEIAKPIPNDMKNDYCSKNHKKMDYEFRSCEKSRKQRRHEKYFQNISKQNTSHIVNGSNENSVKSSCYSSNEELHISDNRIENKVNMDVNEKYVGYKKQNAVSKYEPNDASSRETVLAKKLQQLALNKFDFERKSKMFALASHRL